MNKIDNINNHTIDYINNHTINNISNQTINYLINYVSNYSKIKTIINLKNHSVIRNCLKIGVIGLDHSGNIGNQLIKYSISTVLKSLGFTPYIVGQKLNDFGTSFLNKTTNIVFINNFSDIKKEDYNILMVNSDQTWRRWKTEVFLDIAFLRFAEKWKIPKFTYAVSLGFHKLEINDNEINYVKKLLSNFTGISVREYSSIELIKNKLGVNATHVLDPTLLLDKEFYLSLLNSTNANNNDQRYLLIYKVLENQNFSSIAKEISKKINYSILSVTTRENNGVIKFIEYLNKSSAVITDSFHGTVFSILFNKPFITLLNNIGGDERLLSLNFQAKIEKYFI